MDKVMPEERIRPNFLPVEKWKLTDGGFPVFSDELIKINPCGEYEDIKDSKEWELDALVKVGEWCGHEIHRHFWCDVDIEEDTVSFLFDPEYDEYFFDFENLRGDNKKFEELENILSSVWMEEFEQAIKYTNDHIYRAAELMMEQLGKENPFIKETIDKRNSVYYNGRPVLFERTEIEERE